MQVLSTALLIAVVLAFGPARAENLTGQVSVVDGDTLEMRGARIRLWGIDAPESNQLCRGDDSLPYRCGAAAANRLDEFIAARPITCLPQDVDRYGRTVAVCSVAGIDLGAWLVDRGLALDWPRYSSGKYSPAQEQAQRAERGLWAGSFVEPWNYRSCIRTGGRPADCSDDASASR